MNILGLHHITIVAGNAQRTVDFYTRVLGLRFVKQTVNFDDPSSYHLYFGDEQARPGSIVTFFEWPGAPKGRWGAGGTHHLALRVPTYEALLKWKRRLIDLGLQVNGPLDRHYFTSLYFSDPDGLILELATDGPGWLVDESAETLGTAYQAPPEAMVLANRDAARIAALTHPEPVPVITPDMAILGMHHITAIARNIKRTAQFYEDILGMRRLKQTSNFDDPNSPHWYWGVGEGAPGTILTYFEYPSGRQMQMGAGQTHHLALAVADEEVQLAFRQRLIEAGLPVSPVMERVYFKSIYTRDPDGHIVEIATVPPGFTADEPLEALGRALQLPPWLEAQRGQIEPILVPLKLDA